MTTIAWKSGSSSAGPQQVISSLCTINQPQTLATNDDKHDTAKPGEKTESAHLQQLGSNLELLLQVRHRPLHIEDRLLMLKELLPTMVQGQVYLLQVLDFPLKFQRKQISGHGQGGGIWTSCVAWSSLPSTGLLPGSPCSASWLLLSSSWVRRSHLEAGETLGYLCTKCLLHRVGPAYPCPYFTCWPLSCLSNTPYYKTLPRPRKQTLLLFTGNLKPPEARLLVTGHS